MKISLTLVQKAGAIAVGLGMVASSVAPLATFAAVSPKITICSATASNTNPYVSHSVDENAILNGNGGQGNSGVNVGDIIPPFLGFPGQNWDAAGQAIWNNVDANGNHLCAAPVIPPTPQVCTFVSDATTQEGGHDSVPVPLPVNTGWTASIPTATWVWGELLSDADAQTDKTESFTKVFTVTGTSTATLDVAADNGYKVIVNSIVVDDQTANPPVDNFSTVHHVPTAALNAALHTGVNTIEFQVTNSGAGHPEYTALSNPGGLLYKLDVTAPTCAVVPPIPPQAVTAHITIIKNVVGGTASSSDFHLHVMTAASAEVNGSPFTGSSVGTVLEVPIGTYNVTEDASPSYTASFGANCQNVTLNAGDSVSCTVTNTFVPPSCTLVSDSSTQVNGHDSVPLTFIHSAWTHLLDASGAKWIWGEDGVTDTVNASSEVFTKTVHITGVPTSATLDFSADNGYQVRVNGTLVGGDQINIEHNYEATTTLNILPNLIPNADNTVEITVQNLAMAGGTLATNPAGLDYEIHINNGSCSAPTPPIPPASVCDPSVELLANGGFELPAVLNPANWDIFPSGTAGLGWSVAWMNPLGAPAVANAELQKSGIIAGWNASAGNQYAELDSDWFGTSNAGQGSPSTAISQDVPTIPGETYTLKFDFSARPGTPAADNEVEALFNGTSFGTAGPTDGSATTTTVWTPETYTFVATTTTTHVTLRDDGTSNSLGSFVDNASLHCTPTQPPAPTTATVVATKIVCPNEADLPNLAGSSHITDANTASAFLAAHPACHVQSGWQFEWGNQSAGDGGDAVVGPVGGAYTTSGVTAADGTVHITVPMAGVSEIHMREVLQTGFIPFTFDAASSTPNGNNVSAEFACSDDGLNYDNWEFVRNPQAGSTYYCVAYNAPTVTPPGGGGGPGPNSDTDVCTNIDGIQATVPSGYVIGNTGLCEFVGGRGGGGLPTGGHGHSSSGGNNTPQGQVLGESTTTIPVGAPNTGAGGMSDLVTSLGALIALAGLALVAFATRKNA